MDPLSITVAAVALITVCAQTVQIIKQTIETIKTAKTELINILNQTNRMRLLLEQLRGLTHQLGSRTNSILLSFDKTGCETVLSELQSLFGKLAKAERFVGFQFLVQRSKFEELVAKLRMQEDGIRTVLLSIATESAVFTRDYLQLLVDKANVHAVSISSITQGSDNIVSEPSVSLSDNEKPPVYTSKFSGNEQLSTSSSVTRVTSVGTDTKYETRAQTLELQAGGDLIQLAEKDPSSTPTVPPPAYASTTLDERSPFPKDENLVPQSSGANITRSGRSEEVEPMTLAPSLTKKLSGVAVWHGRLSRDLYDGDELALRDDIAEAAKYGDWHVVEKLIASSTNDGINSSSNIHRVGNPNSTSGWTALHQAAFICASRDTAHILVKNGASRTLRTLWTSPSELPFRSMTALEIAQSLGFRHLFDILSPIVRHPIPHSAMSRIQQRFHDLILDELADRPEYSGRLRLPELEPLTELKNPEMYFPLGSSKAAMGYFYRLDGRELLVASLGISELGRHMYYRITETETVIIEDAIFFDVS